jgi:hypothetical protein
VQQLARLARPGGTVVLADFCRKAGPLTPQLSVRMAAMDDIFATAGDWKSADDWKAFMGEAWCAALCCAADAPSQLLLW